MKNGKRCRTHHGLDLHAAIKAEICKCLKPDKLIFPVLMYILLKQEVWVGYIKDNLFKIVLDESSIFYSFFSRQHFK